MTGWADQIERMTEADETACWADRTDANRWRLVRHHLALGMVVAKRLRGLYGPTADYDVLVERVVEALYEVTGRFNPSRARFSTFATQMIPFLVGRALSNETEARATYHKTRRWKVRPPIAVEDVGQAVLESITKTSGSHRGSRARRAIRVFLYDLLRDRCTGQERRLMRLVYWDGVTPTEAAQQMGVSRQRGFQLHHAALTRLRSALRRSRAAGMLFVEP